MRKVGIAVAMFGLSLFCTLSSAYAQTAPGIFEPDRGKIGLSMGYQYQHYDVFGRSFHDNGYNADLTVHLVDWITGASARLAVAGEGTSAFGFGNAVGKPNITANSLFLGGGARVSVVSGSRIEPWIHVLPGWQHFRFTQGGGLGSNSAFGFMGGGGIDFRLARALYWRVQGDYVGTHFRSNLQNNYSLGSGFAFYF